MHHEHAANAARLPAPCEVTQPELLEVRRDPRPVFVDLDIQRLTVTDAPADRREVHYGLVCDGPRSMMSPKFCQLPHGGVLPVPCPASPKESVPFE